MIFFLKYESFLIKNSPIGKPSAVAHRNINSGSIVTQKCPFSLLHSKLNFNRSCTSPIYFIVSNKNFCLLQLEGGEDTPIIKIIY